MHYWELPLLCIIIHCHKLMSDKLQQWCWAGQGAILGASMGAGRQVSMHYLAITGQSLYIPWLIWPAARGVRSYSNLTVLESNGVHLLVYSNSVWVSVPDLSFFFFSAKIQRQMLGLLDSFDIVRYFLVSTFYLIWIKSEIKRHWSSKKIQIHDGISNSNPIISCWLFWNTALLLWLDLDLNHRNQANVRAHEPKSLAVSQRVWSYLVCRYWWGASVTVHLYLQLC